MPDASVARRINAERLTLLSWSRAILMQLAHPLVAAGVDEHSTFRGGRFTAAARLHHTIQAMLSLTFGDEGTQQQTLERIRAIHRRVNGTLPQAAGRFAAGTPYSAEDPDLLLWVHATLLDSIVPLHDQVVEPLDARTRDAYCAESAPIAVALGARAAEVPRTWAAVRDYVDGMVASDAIAVSAQARALAGAVLAPPFAPVVWPAARLNRLVTVGALPPKLRTEYGFAWTPRDARRLQQVLRLLRRARRIAPPFVTRWSRS